MKKIFVSVSILTALAMVIPSAFAATTQTQTANVSVASILSIEFASTTDTTLGGGALSWASINPTSSLINVNGHVATKPDTGVICKYNGGSAWALKMRFVSANGLNGKLKYYMGQPYYNGVATNGTLGNPPPGPGQDWPIVPNIDFTVYTSGLRDQNNVPNGTFIGIDYGMNPEGLTPSVAYTGIVTYTVVVGP